MSSMYSKCAHAGRGEVNVEVESGSEVRVEQNHNASSNLACE
jgi:hypothetical protein